MVDPRVQAGMVAQLEHWRAALDAGAQRIGWKIGFNIPELQKTLGIDEPVLGHLTSQSLLHDGATWDASDAVHARAELEVAITIGDDGGASAYAVALELVDVGRPPGGGIEGIVGVNIFHRAVIFGPAVAALPRDLDARLTINGAVHPATITTVDVAATIELAGRHLAAAGERLEPGDRIIAGALVHEQVRSGDEVAGEIAGLGRISVSIG